MFLSGIATQMLTVIDKWLGRLPGRLGLLAVSGGTLLSTLTGNSMATTAVLGSLLVPEMEKRGYKKPMSLGPVLGSAGLAIMIPPSGLAILLAALAKISIARILIGGVVPGLLMAALYAAYIIVRCWLQPSVAPSYDVTPTPLSEKLVATVRHVLPLGFIILSVLGVIFLGIATPSEAAATGVLASFILAASYKRLNWKLVKKSLLNTVQVTVMMFMIISGSMAFSQVLASSGASAGLIRLVGGLPLPPIMVVAVMQALIVILGMFMDVISIMMITIPIFFPIIHAMGFNPLWFGLLMLLNIEVAVSSPPFGLNLFVMKGVAPVGTTMGDIYRAGIPFIGCDLTVIALMIAFPAIALWLPGLMI